LNNHIKLRAIQRQKSLIYAQEQMKSEETVHGAWIVEYIDNDSMSAVLSLYRDKQKPYAHN
jgi:hypothetical protein